MYVQVQKVHRETIVGKPSLFSKKVEQPGGHHVRDQWEDEGIDDSDQTILNI